MVQDNVLETIAVAAAVISWLVVPFLAKVLIVIGKLMNRIHHLKADALGTIRDAVGATKLHAHGWQPLDPIVGGSMLMVLRAVA